MGVASAAQVIVLNAAVHDIDCAIKALRSTGTDCNVSGKIGDTLDGGPGDDTGTGGTETDSGGGGDTVGDTIVPSGGTDTITQ